MKREPKGIVTFNREVLTTYRDVMKVTARYNWNNENGEPWKLILRASARIEFEEIRKEIDPVVVGQFVITWKDAVIRMHEKVNDVNMKMSAFIEETRTDSINNKAFNPFEDT